MRISVVADNSGAIHCKHNMEVLNRSIMQQHVITALQEAGINRKHRRKPLFCHGGRHRDRMPFGNADVKETFRIPRCEILQTGSARHGCRNSDQLRLLDSKLQHRVSKHLGKIGLFGRQYTSLRIEFSDTVIFFGSSLRIRDAPALLRNDMQDYRLAQIACPAEHSFQLRNVMSVDGPDIIKAHIIKHVIRKNSFFHVLLHGMNHIINRLHLADRLAIKLFKAQIAGLHSLLGQERRHTADIFVNRHTVIIQNDNHRFSALTRILQSLISQSAGQSAVANQRNHIIVLVQNRSCSGHTKSC